MKLIYTTERNVSFVVVVVPWEILSSFDLISAEENHIFYLEIVHVCK